MRRGSRLATRRWRASISRATSSIRSGTTPSLHARHNTPHVALNCACVLRLSMARRATLTSGAHLPLGTERLAKLVVHEVGRNSTFETIVSVALSGAGDLMRLQALSIVALRRCSAPAG